MREFSENERWAKKSLGGDHSGNRKTKACTGGFQERSDDDGQGIGEEGSWR